MSKSLSVPEDSLYSLADALSLEPDPDLVREYAYHLYEQSGRTAGHDVDHWLEATACLKANLAGQSAPRRLYRARGPGAHGDAM